MSAHLGSLSPELDHLVNMEKNIASIKLPAFSCALVPKAVRKAWFSMAPSPHVRNGNANTYQFKIQFMAGLFQNENK